MGGAVGHLYHLYDNPDLTFGEIKDIIKSAAAGKLEQVSEKLDGLNLVFTWDESGSGLRVARNAGDIKSGGMDANALAAKFADRGNLADAFNSAFKVLNQALGSLPPAARAKVFGPDGRIWYSMELIYSANPNVIQYDGNNVVFHGWPVFKAMPDGTVEKGPGGGVGFLSKYIEQMQKHVKEKDWRVRGPALVALKKMSNKAVPQKALTAINRAMANARVGDDDTIQDYLFNYVIADAKAAKMPPAVLHDIAARVAGIPGAPNLTQIKSKIDKSLVPAVQDYVKVGPKTIKSAIAPIESAIHEFAVEALRGLTSTLISNSPGEVDRLRGEVQKAVSAIEASGNEQAMSILKTQMAKLGSIENLATPMEGVVFIHNGNAYKFTGAFAPVNQILGLFKYGRGKTKLASEGSRLLASLVKEALIAVKNDDGREVKFSLTKAELQQLSQFLTRSTEDGGLGKQVFSPAEYYTSDEFKSMKKDISSNLFKQEMIKQGYTTPDRNKGVVLSSEPNLWYTQKMVEKVLNNINIKLPKGKKLSLSDINREQIEDYIERDRQDFATLIKRSIAAAEKEAHAPYSSKSKLFKSIEDDHTWQELLKRDKAAGSPLQKSGKIPQLLAALKQIRIGGGKTQYFSRVYDSILENDPKDLATQLFSVKWNGSGAQKITIPELLVPIAQLDTISGGGSKGSEVGQGELAIPFMFAGGTENTAWVSGNAVEDVKIHGHPWHLKAVPRFDSANIRLGMSTYSGSKVQGKLLNLVKKKRWNAAHGIPTKELSQQMIRANADLIIETWGSLQRFQDEIDSEMRSLGIGSSTGVGFYLQGTDQIVFVPKERCYCGGATTGAHTVTPRRGRLISF